METLIYFGVGLLLLIIAIGLIYLLGLFVGKYIFGEDIFYDFEDVFLHGIMGIFGAGMLFCLLLAFTLLGKLIITNI